MTRRRRRPTPRVLRHLHGPCPDCAAEFDDKRRLIHQDGCPIARGIEEACAADKAWFLDNPDETVRIRAAVHAEVQDLKHLAPTVAWPHRVHVRSHPWGRSRLFVSGGDDQMLILDTE